MSKIIKNIPVFFLWLAWLFLTAHMIIPHDHHLIESVTYPGESCPLSNNKSDHHSGNPIHCHAFNDLASEKARLHPVSGNNQLIFIAFCCLPDISVSRLHITCITTFDFQKPGIDSYTLGLTSLRAPPALA
jgi:hypothetical protein